MQGLATQHKNLALPTHSCTVPSLFIATALTTKIMRYLKRNSCKLKKMIDNFSLNLGPPVSGVDRMLSCCDRTLILFFCLWD